MAPKKKGKTNKLAKMSDEERARYLQHRAGIEEEARRRKQELIARYMKNKLHKEETYIKINLAKINQQWRFLLRRLKVKEMRQQLQMMITSFARMTESKNAVISRLMTSLEEAEDQYSRMMQCHMEMITKFLEIGGDRLKLFHTNFEEQKYTLIEQWEEESQSLESSQKEAEYSLQLIMYQQEQNITRHTDEADRHNAHAANYKMIMLNQDLKDMTGPKQVKLEAVWNELRSVFSSYVTYHAPKIQQYQLLREKDENYRREINIHMDQLLATSDVISHYQNEWENLADELELKAKITTAKKVAISKLYSEARTVMTEETAKDKHQMITLTVESYNAIKKLENVLRKGQKILQMEANCSKYETDGEKVLPWKMLDYSKQETLQNGIMESAQVYDKLENFWFNLNRVLVHTTALKAERDSLKQENKYLKGCLKSLLMEAAVGDNGAASTEITGRPASMRMYRVAPLIGGPCDMTHPIQRRPVTCIEASTCNTVQHQRRMNQIKMRSLVTQKVIVPKQCW